MSPQYESPLNVLADKIPDFIMQLQDMKMRQEAQEALNSYRNMMLEERVSAREAEEETRRTLEEVRREMGYYEPPEVKVLRDNISQELRILNDPGVSLTLGDDEIEKRWKRLINIEADYFGKTGRHISVSMPIPVEEALARIEKDKPPPAAALPPPKERLKPRGGREIRPRLVAPEAPPEPLSPEEIAAQRAGIPALQPPPPLNIPEGARSVLTKEGGWVYTLDEKVWISAETGEPITGQ